MCNTAERLKKNTDLNNITLEKEALGHLQRVEDLILATQRLIPAIFH